MTDGALLDAAEIWLLAERYPLAAWRAWDGGPGKTSQLRALRYLIEWETLLLWGGNKSGKSELNLASGVAWAFGGDHPATQQWLLNNGLPLDLIPKGPGVTWFLAPSHADSKRYHRGRVAHLTGVGDDAPGWRNRHADQEAILWVPVPGYSKPAMFVFKAHSQGVQGMKGDAIRYLGVDEECPEGMYNQAVIRLGEEEGGRCVFSMTHDVHSGHNWVKPRFIEGKEPGATSAQIFSIDNPNIPRGVLERRVAGMSEVERAAALRGEWGTMHGLCFEEYRHGLHVIPAREVPKDWPRYEAFDFGWGNPNCILTGALDPDGILEVYREFYRPRLTAAQVADIAIANATAADDYIVRATGDPTALTSIEELRNAGIPISPSTPRDVEEGIKAVNARFASMRIRIHDSCVNLIREIPNYRRGKNGKPIKVNDHACDDLRYLTLLVDSELDGAVSMAGALDSTEFEQESPWNV